MKKSSSILIVAVTAMLSTQVLAIPNVNPPPGRVAYVADGNSPDPDDLGGSAVALALLKSAGLESRLVHYSHSCDLIPTNISTAHELARHQMMQVNADGTASIWDGFHGLTMYDAKHQQTATVNDLRDAINASSASDPLWIIEAGEPDITGYALAAANSSKRQYVKVVTHHPANDNSGDFFTWAQILAFGVEEVRIGDQNVKLKVNLSQWDWAKNHADHRIRWIWEQGKIAEQDPVVNFQHGFFDCSDAGMILYWITGANVNGGLASGSVTNIKDLLLAHVASVPSRTLVANAESATITNGAVANDDVALGGQYVDGAQGFNLTWNIDSEATSTDLIFRSNSPSGARNMGVFVNNNKVGTISADAPFWKAQMVSAELADGVNTIELRDSEGTTEPNVDYICLAGFGGSDELLATNFSGRVVTGKTASNIPWTANGIQNPGNLTFVPEGSALTNTGLFNTTNAQGHFAPDINIGSEGPWSVTVPLVLTTQRVQLSSVVLGWQHFDNSGNFQTQSRSANWSISVIGNSSGLIGSASSPNVSGTSGTTTLAFNNLLVLEDSETYQLRIDVNSSVTSGNNTGLAHLAVNGQVITEDLPNLIARYRFDTSSSGNTPDTAPGSSAHATLNSLAINTTAGIPKAGGGALEMSGSGTGAITSNSFSWSASDVRSIAFWWRAKSPNVNTSTGTYLSMGSGSGTGARFDVRENGSTSLRTEVNADSASANPAIDNGNWHFITLIVPTNNAALGDVRAYLNGNTSTDLYAGNNSVTPIDTAGSALHIGGSILGGRVPNGYLDELQIYDGVLTPAQIQFLYQNPGLVLTDAP